MSLLHEPLRRNWLGTRAVSTKAVFMAVVFETVQT